MKVVAAREAAALLPHSATLAISGAWMLVPDALLAAIETRFLATGEPRDLTASFLLCPGGTADQPGIERISHEGLLARTIGGSYPNLPDSRLRRLIAANRVQAHNLPAGMLAAWFRETGAGRPGVFTGTGIGTFVDPAIEGGQMNEAAGLSLVQPVTLPGGQRLLHLPSLPVQAALIRATTADANGNLTMENEPATLCAFAQACAARASGGIVIAQVKQVLGRDAAPLHPHSVKVPGSLVDYVVEAPEALQAAGIAFDPTLCGGVSGDWTPDAAATGAEAADQLMARRAIREIRDGDTVVLGYGISALIPHLMLMDGTFRRAAFAIEQGSYGGLPLPGFGFGNSRNPAAILDACSQFDIFQGGCFNLGVLSFLQVDATGRVNVHRLDARPALSAGIGGFLDIAANAPRLVLIGYFTAGGLELEVDGLGVRVKREGRMRKFVRKLDHISFDPAFARAREVMIVTERCVFRAAGGELALVEVAPGIDAERDVLAHMEFRPKVEV